MSEVDVNSIPPESFSQLNTDMENMQKDLQILLNISYYMLGAVTTIGGMIGYKYVSKCFKKKIVRVKEEEVRLLDTIEKMDEKIDNIAVAVKVNETNEETV